MKSPPAAAVVIVTKDRRDDALRAVASAVAQQPPVEVLVLDDGSSDGTADAVREEFPDIRVEQRVRSEGRFRGTAHAVRRETFFELGGYRGMLFQPAEEPDLAVRMLDAGDVIRLGRADPVRDFASPHRDVERMWFYECRNAVLFAWHNVPMPDLMVQLAKTTAHAFWLGRGVRRTGLFVRGLAAGFREAARGRSARRPASRDTWRLYTRLGRQPMRIDELVDVAS